MTPQEHEALSTLLGQLVQVRGTSKDAQADSLIQSAAAQQPDAVYLLVQRVMLLDQALAAAKQQASALQARLDSAERTPAASNASFLDANAWGNGASTAPASPSRELEQEMSVTGRPLGSYAGQQGQQGGQFQGGQPGMGNGLQASAPQRSSFLGGGAGGMLGTMAATAAGVAGGAFLFQGIGSLLGNNHPAAAVAEGGNKGAGHDAAAGSTDGAGTSDHSSQHGVADTAGNDYSSDASFDDLSGVDSGLSGFDDDSSAV